MNIKKDYEIFKAKGERRSLVDGDNAVVNARNPQETQNEQECHQQNPQRVLEVIVLIRSTPKDPSAEIYENGGVTAKTIEHTTSLIAKNDEFKAQLHEKGFAIAALKNELRKLSGNSVNTKFEKSSILRKPVLQPHRNQSVVRQQTAFKSERPRISKPWFASQVDVNNNLSKSVTTHYLPKERKSCLCKTSSCDCI
ncbi:hypothetical protein Tco_0241743 [Tanacetum coccineum]